MRSTIGLCFAFAFGLTNQWTCVASQVVCRVLQSDSRKLLHLQFWLERDGSANIPQNRQKIRFVYSLLVEGLLSRLIMMHLSSNPNISECDPVADWLERVYL